MTLRDVVPKIFPREKIHKLVVWATVTFTWTKPPPPHLFSLMNHHSLVTCADHHHRLPDKQLHLVQNTGGKGRWRTTEVVFSGEKEKKKQNHNWHNGIFLLTAGIKIDMGVQRQNAENSTQKWTIVIRTADLEGNPWYESNSLWEFRKQTKAVPIA